MKAKFGKDALSR